MASRAPFRSPYTLLALAALAALALVIGSGGPDPEISQDSLPPDCRGLSVEECRALLQSQSTPIPPAGEATVLAADDVCLNVGYLCAEVEAAGSLELVHWPVETPMIRVLVPEPTGLPSREARALQAAAVSGIRTWNRHPIPVSVRTRPWADPPDITVEWARTVDDGRLGRAEVEWARTGREVRFRVVGFVIATHTPGSDTTPLSAGAVELVAAHEMGHALGLPHSDDPRDVMFPTNTSTRLTARDFRTVAALYQLPAGAEIRR